MTFANAWSLWRGSFAVPFKVDDSILLMVNCFQIVFTAAPKIINVL